MNGPLATYEALLKIFVDAEENDCAEVLCKFLGAGMNVLCVCTCVLVCVHVYVRGCVHACVCVCALLETEAYFHSPYGVARLLRGNKYAGQDRIGQDVCV